MNVLESAHHLQKYEHGEFTKARYGVCETYHISPHDNQDVSNDLTLLTQWVSACTPYELSQFILPHQINFDGNLCYPQSINISFSELNKLIKHVVNGFHHRFDFYLDFYDINGVPTIVLSSDRTKNANDLVSEYLNCSAPATLGRHYSQTSGMDSPPREMEGITSINDFIDACDKYTLEVESKRFIKEYAKNGFFVPLTKLKYTEWVDIYSVELLAEKDRLLKKSETYKAMLKVGIDLAKKG